MDKKKKSPSLVNSQNEPSVKNSRCEDIIGYGKR